MATKRELLSAFEKHFSKRVRKENAITPGQKKILIGKLRQELKEDGRVPLPTGPVKLDVKHPVVKAALSGRSVSMSGKIVKKEYILIKSQSSEISRYFTPLKGSILSTIMRFLN